MKRRNIIVLLGATAASGSAVVGSGAFSSVEADRDLDVSVVGDEDAYLALDYPSTVTVGCDGAVSLAVMNQTGSGLHNFEAEFEFDDPKGSIEALSLNSNDFTARDTTARLKSGNTFSLGERVEIETELVNMKGSGMSPLYVDITAGDGTDELSINLGRRVINVNFSCVGPSACTNPITASPESGAPDKIQKNGDIDSLSRDVNGDVRTKDGSSGDIDIDGTGDRVDIAGDVDADNDIGMVKQAIISGDVTAGGNIDMTGGDVKVGGSVIAGSGSDIDGISDSTVGGNVVGQNVDIKNGSTICGDVETGDGGDIGEISASEIGGNVISDNDADIKNGTTVFGDVDSHGDVNVYNSNIKANVSAEGDVTVQDKSTVEGDVFTDGNVDISGGSTVEGNVDAGGNVSVSDNSSV